MSLGARKAYCGALLSFFEERPHQQEVHLYNYIGCKGLKGVVDAYDRLELCGLCKHLWYALPAHRALSHGTPLLCAVASHSSICVSAADA